MTNVSLDQRWTFFGGEKSRLESLSSDVVLNGVCPGTPERDAVRNALEITRRSGGVPVLGHVPNGETSAVGGILDALLRP